MKLERVAVYVPDVLVMEARKNGMTNFSQFVREKLIEYNAVASTAKSNATATAPRGGHDNVCV
jgi:hypothetical protein